MTGIELALAALGRLAGVDNNKVRARSDQVGGVRRGFAVDAVSNDPKHLTREVTTFEDGLPRPSLNLNNSRRDGDDRCVIGGLETGPAATLLVPCFAAAHLCHECGRACGANEVQQIAPAALVVLLDPTGSTIAEKGGPAPVPGGPATHKRMVGSFGHRRREPVAAGGVSPATLLLDHRPHRVIMLWCPDRNVSHLCALILRHSIQGPIRDYSNIFIRVDHERRVREDEIFKSAILRYANHKHRC
jgi:hypothetical protein